MSAVNGPATSRSSSVTVVVDGVAPPPSARHDAQSGAPVARIFSDSWNAISAFFAFAPNAPSILAW